MHVTRSLMAVAAATSLAALAGSGAAPAHGGTDGEPRTRSLPACCALSEFLSRWGCLADPYGGAGDVPPLKQTACAILYGLAGAFCDLSSCER